MLEENTPSVTIIATFRILFFTTNVKNKAKNQRTQAPPPVPKPHPLSTDWACPHKEETGVDEASCGGTQPGSRF